nr:MAG TPA: hypothetical protein [Caudoviricetes sp.]
MLYYSAEIIQKCHLYTSLLDFMCFRLSNG